MFNLKSQKSEHILSCIAYCGKIDQKQNPFQGHYAPDENTLRMNAGLSQDIEQGGRDEMIAKGSYEWLQEFHKDPASFSLSNTNIKSLHRKVFKFSSRDDGVRGRYRTDLDNEMKILFDETKAALASDDRHSLFTISLFRVSFIKAMPFITGNTLCANLIAYALLFNNGFSIVSQLPLLPSLNNADSTDPLSALSKTFFELLSATPTPTDRKLHTPDPYLNSRRKSLLKHIQKFAPQKISDIMIKFPNESRNTIKKDLLYLREENMIIAQGQGRGMFYTSVDNT